MEPLPGLVVHGGLTEPQVVGLAAAVHAGVQPRVWVLPGAGQVAGRRGAVVGVEDPRKVGAECIRVRMRHDGDVLPFAPHELALISGAVRGGRGAHGVSIDGPRPGWTLERALDRLAQGYSMGHVARLSGFGEAFLRAHQQSDRRGR